MHINIHFFLCQLLNYENIIGFVDFFILYQIMNLFNIHLGFVLSCYFTIGDHTIKMITVISTWDKFDKPIKKYFSK